MQINPFGFPLGGGPTTTIGGAAAQSGFASAMNLALGAPMAAGAANPLVAASDAGARSVLGNSTSNLFDTAPALGTVSASLPGVPTAFMPALPDEIAPLADMAQPIAQAPVATPSAANDSISVPVLLASPNAPAILPRLQTQTSLSQLLTTAARLSAAAEPLAVPAEPAPTAVAPSVVNAPTVVDAPVAVEPQVSLVFTTALKPITGAVKLADAVPVTSEVALPTRDNAVTLPGEAQSAPAAQPEVAAHSGAAAKPAAAPRKVLRQPIEAPVESGVAHTQAAAGQPILVQVAAASNLLPPVTASTAARGEAKTSATPAGIANRTNSLAIDLPGTPSNATPTLANGDFARAIASQGGKGDTGAGNDDPAGHEPVGAVAGKVEATPAFALHNAGAPVPAHTASPTPPETVIAARANHVGQALGVEIARKVEAGEDVLRVRLNPDQLGRVEVTLAFDDKGSLQATVRAESAHALDLLRQDAPDLARTLDQAGIRTDAQSFRFESRADTGGSNSQTASQQQQGRGGQPQHQARHDDLEPAPAYRAIRADGQVDLLA
jgi:flagellar hook-length control protein FliK